jgi:hypothetical protein
MPKYFCLAAERIHSLSFSNFPRSSFFRVVKLVLHILSSFGIDELEGVTIVSSHHVSINLGKFELVWKNFCLEKITYMSLNCLINVNVHSWFSIIPQVPNFYGNKVSCYNFFVSLQEIYSAVLIYDLAEEVFVVSSTFEL